MDASIRRRPRPALGKVGIGILLIPILAFAPAYAGSIEYPLPGNFELEEGTIEIWFSPTIELEADEDPAYRSIARLMTIKVRDGFTLGAICFSKHRRLTIGFHMAHPTDNEALLSIYGDLPGPLKPGEPVHLALAWRGREMAAFVNGQSIGTLTQGTTLSGVLVNQVVRFGDASREPPVILHAVRVSRAARDEASLKNASSEPDALTLLLDRFDTPDHVGADGRSTPQKISSLDGTSTGVTSGHVRFVAEPKPGLELAPAPTAPSPNTQ